MTLRVVRLGSPRHPDEGLRIGTVRRPPRGVPKEEFAARDFYDVWFPNLAPSDALLSWAHGQPLDDKGWKAFARRYQAEMGTPENRRVLDLIAALSQQANLSVGCYCADEARCHRTLLRALLLKHGAKIEG
jgi:uncharacterized protein YeaO (DUF488 family)